MDTDENTLYTHNQNFWVENGFYLIKTVSGKFGWQNLSITIFCPPQTQGQVSPNGCPLLVYKQHFAKHRLRTLRGHPFMTSTRRGRGGQTQVDGGGGSSPMWTSTQKIKIRV